MAGIRLEWAQFGDFDSFDVLRSGSPMDINALPSPLVAGLPTMFYVDTAVIEGATYYYRVVAWRDGVSKISSEIMVKAQAGDEYWDSVMSLLHFDAADNSTVFTDETGRRLWNELGGTKIKTDQSVFGGSSVYFNGSSSLTSGLSSGFAYDTGDFTWELFARLSKVTGNNYIIDHGNGGGNGGTLSYYNGTLRYYNSTTGVDSGLYNTGIPLAVDRWYHIAIVRLNGITTIYVDGTAKASGADGHNYGSLGFWLGSYAVSNEYCMFGWIDELRITKGIARYTANFTPPDAPFPSN